MTYRQEIGNKTSKSKNYSHWLIEISLSQLTNQNLFTNGTFTSGFASKTTAAVSSSSAPARFEEKRTFICPFLF